MAAAGSDLPLVLTLLRIIGGLTQQERVIVYGVVSALKRVASTTLRLIARGTTKLPIQKVGARAGGLL
jgi:hypothetical protein